MEEEREFILAPIEEKVKFDKISKSFPEGCKLFYAYVLICGMCTKAKADY